MAFPRKNGPAAGFTLIELMIVVSLIAILAAIALPSYSDYTRRARAAEAVALLGTWRSQLEQYYLDNRSYANAGGDCGKAAPTSGNYTLTCVTPAGGQTYTLTATSVVANEGVYTLNEANEQKTTKFKGSTVSLNCWAIKGGEC